MEFSYSYIKTETAQLEIEDIGNVSIEATTSLGFFYYLIIKTYDGFSQILQFGPYQHDFDSQPSKKTIIQSWVRIPFSDKQIIKTIDNFLNDPYKGIVEANLIDREVAYDKVVSMVEYMKNHDY